MKSTYIYLSQENNTKLRKLAQAKQLSLSACVDVILKNYYYVIQYFQTQDKMKNYLEKGNIKIKLHVKSRETLNTDDLTIHNAVICYLNQKHLTDYPNQTGLKQINKHIQHDLDTTYDRNWLKNELIRQNYRQRTQQ